MAASLFLPLWVWAWPATPSVTTRRGTTTPITQPDAWRVYVVVLSTTHTESMLHEGPHTGVQTASLWVQLAGVALIVGCVAGLLERPARAWPGAMLWLADWAFCFWLYRPPAPWVVDRVVPWGWVAAVLGAGSVLFASDSARRRLRAAPAYPDVFD
jgi:hypothetical protein